ncbi:MAG: SBBP repeat-containing protein, partial [Nitrospiraceae bacterium]
QELDGGTGLAVDSGGHAYVTGNTSSLGCPGAAHSSILSTKGGGFFDAFVAKLNAAGTALVYSTYLGGSRDDSGFGIAVDSGGHAYVTGNTSSFGFPGTASSSIQSAFGGGDADAFVAKLNATGTALVYATYLGGSGYDDGRAIVVDQAGQAYVTGSTDTPGSGFPGTAGSPIQGSFAGGAVDGYVTKLNAPGTALVYSTYLGGSGNDGGNGIAVDQAGNAYVTGITSTPGSGFPGTADSSIQSTFGGFFDAYVTKLNAAGTALVYSTYLGGSGDDDGEGIAVDPLGNAYVTGTTGTPGSGFPGTVGSLIQNTLAGHTDIFVAKITTNTSPSCSAAQAVPNILWSPNHQFLSIAVHGVTDPDGNPVTITIIGITQDEPVNAKGEGNMSPDAVIQAGSASVRAERAGNGDGRVYQVSFRADDGQGGFCTGAVKVSVPHSLQKGSTAIDDGQVYDSTIP